MKLKTSDIYSDFQERFFDIPINTLPERGTRFTDSSIHCKISVKLIKEGHEINGDLRTKIGIECVRCLGFKSSSITVTFKIILCDSALLDMKKNSTEDTIYLPSNVDYIDINNIIADLIELSTPMNPLCNKTCLGLCERCGINKNHFSCSCKIENKNLISSNLKILKSLKE